MSDIQELTEEQMSEVIKTRRPTGKFYRQDGSTVVGVDNTTGDAWTEEFNDFDACIRWLNREEEYQDGERHQCASDIENRQNI
ncbi:MAG: hypothetical protein PHE09_17025 [Oscillospiraceae bacterium]|nr:hypothetical protein [Oscillospiraceae bacterium]